MSTSQKQAASDMPEAARLKSWVKALLFGSLALNLAAIGLFAGMSLRAVSPPPMQRGEMGLGPLTAVLSREDWKAMRPAFLAHHPDLRRGALALQSDFDPVLVALRAERFDPQALDAALQSVSGKNAQRLASAQQVISDYIKDLPEAERRDLADRLQHRLEETARKHAKKSETKSN